MYLKLSKCVLMFQEMLGELFTPVETPEAPNRGFFKGLFGGGAQSLDREELCTSNQHKTRDFVHTLAQIFTVVQFSVIPKSNLLSNLFFFPFL